MDFIHHRRSPILGCDRVKHSKASFSNDQQRHSSDRCRDIELSGYASIFGTVDAYGDTVTHGAFTRYLRRDAGSKSTCIKVLWQHEHTNPIGRVLRLKEDRTGLWSDLYISAATNEGRKAIMLISRGVVNGLSIGYIPVRYSRDVLARKRDIEELQLLEISIVTFPANNLAKIVSYKQLDD